MKAGDRIDKMSQKMQMSRKTFQELDYVFAQNGANIEIMQTSMNKIAQAMTGAQKGVKGNVLTFRQLGISLKDTSGRIKSAENGDFSVRKWPFQKSSRKKRFSQLLYLFEE